MSEQSPAEAVFFRRLERVHARGAPPLPRRRLRRRLGLAPLVRRLLAAHEQADSLLGARSGGRPRAARADPAAAARRGGPGTACSSYPAAPSERPGSLGRLSGAGCWRCSAAAAWGSCCGPSTRSAGRRASGEGGSPAKGRAVPRPVTASCARAGRLAAVSHDNVLAVHAVEDAGPGAVPGHAGSSTGQAFQAKLQARSTAAGAQGGGGASTPRGGRRQAWRPPTPAAWSTTTSKPTNILLQVRQRGASRSTTSAWRGGRATLA